MIKFGKFKDFLEIEKGEVKVKWKVRFWVSFWGVEMESWDGIE